SRTRCITPRASTASTAGPTGGRTTLPRRRERPGPSRGRAGGGTDAARAAVQASREVRRGHRRGVPAAQGAAFVRSVTRDGGAGRRGRRLRFGSAPPRRGGPLGRRPRPPPRARAAPPPPLATLHRTPATARGLH